MGLEHESFFYALGLMELKEKRSISALRSNNCLHQAIWTSERRTRNSGRASWSTKTAGYGSYDAGPPLRLDVAKTRSSGRGPWNTKAAGYGFYDGEKEDVAPLLQRLPSSGHLDVAEKD